MVLVIRFIFNLVMVIYMIPRLQLKFYLRLIFLNSTILADRAYGTNEIFNYIQQHGSNYVMPHSYNNYLTPMEFTFFKYFFEQSVAKKLDQYNIKIENFENFILNIYLIIDKLSKKYAINNIIKKEINIKQNYKIHKF